MNDYILVHSGIKGQKWGVRRFQEEDGTLTEAGKRRYGRGSSAGIPSNVPKSGYKITNRPSSAGMPSNVPKSGYKVTNRPSSAGMPSNVPKSGYKVTNKTSNHTTNKYVETHKPSLAGIPQDILNRRGMPYANSSDPIYNDPRLKNVPNEFLYGSSPETWRRYLDNKEEQMENALDESTTTLNELSRLANSKDIHDRATLFSSRYKTVTNATKAASLIASISGAKAKSAYDYEDNQRKTTISALKKLSNSLGKIVKSVSSIFSK